MSVINRVLGTACTALNNDTFHMTHQVICDGPASFQYILDLVSDRICIIDFQYLLVRERRGSTEAMTRVMGVGGSYLADYVTAQLGKDPTFDFGDDFVPWIREYVNSSGAIEESIAAVSSSNTQLEDVEVMDEDVFDLISDDRLSRIESAPKDSRLSDWVCHRLEC